MDILAHFKDWISTRFITSRKRRSILEEDDYFVRSKMQKMSRPEDKIISTYRPVVVNNKSRPSWAKENLTISIDDDDDDVMEAKNYNSLNNSKSKKFTSTPVELRSESKSLLNGNDDVAFVSCEKLSNSNDKKKKFDFSRINSNCMTSSDVKSSEFLTPITNISNDERKSKLKTITVRKPLRSSVLNQSFRLDEKEKYKELLEKVAPNVNVRSTLDLPFMKYINTSRTFSRAYSDRTRRLIDLSQQITKQKSTDFIDLTKSINGQHLSSRERIHKVDIDNDTVLIKDSDSDVEILPTPPDPEPDIKVERVNSLKHLVRTVEPTRKDWLHDRTQGYQDRIRECEKQIQEFSTYREKLHEINRDINCKLLEDKWKKSMRIKDEVLPVEVPEETTELPVLTDEQKHILAVAFNPKGSPNEVLVKKFNLSITRRDILTLSGLSWLNDEVINFYMNLIIERGKNPKWPNVYAMNTFFYPKLLKDGPASLRRWTRRVDIFANDMLVVPIHLGMHWCMAVINFCEKSIKYYDSMGGSNRKCLEALKDYLIAEHLDKKQSAYDVSDWKLDNVKDIPQQMNGSDCGMFSCTFAEFLTRNAKFTFSQENMPYLRKKMVVEIITGELLIT